jgi:hypothetical protein
MPADAYDENYDLLRTLRSRYIKYILRRDWPLCKTWGLEPPILRNGRKKTFCLPLVNEAADRRRIVLCRKNERDGTRDAGTGSVIRQQISSGGWAAGGSEL